MGLFSRRTVERPTPENRYAQVRVTVGGRVILGWMVDRVEERPSVAPGIVQACSVPEEIDGYPVLGVTPDGMQSLFHRHLTLPKNAIFVCLRNTERELLSKKFDSDKREALPKLTSSQVWKFCFYQRTVGSWCLNVTGGCYTMSDEIGGTRKLYDLKLDGNYMDAHTLDVFMHFASDRVTINGVNVRYDEHYPCLIREDITDPVTVEIAKNGTRFF